MTLTEPVDLDRLRACVDDIARWSAESVYEVNRYHDRYSTSLLYHREQYTEEGLGLAWLLDRYGPLISARATRLEPGGFIVPHRDPDQGCMERWQIPVYAAGTFTVAGRVVPQVPGVPWLVPYTEEHSLAVPGDAPEARVVLVIDRRA